MPNKKIYLYNFQLIPMSGASASQNILELKNLRSWFTSVCVYVYLFKENIPKFTMNTCLLIVHLTLAKALY